MFKIISRAKNWKHFVEQRLLEGDARIAEQDARIAEQNEQIKELYRLRRDDLAQISALKSDMDALLARSKVERALVEALCKRFDSLFHERLDQTRLVKEPVLNKIMILTSAHLCLLGCRRGAEVLFLLATQEDAVANSWGGHSPADIVEAICGGEISSATLFAWSQNGVETISAPWLIEAIQREPLVAIEWLSQRQPLREVEDQRPYLARFDAVLSNIDLIDFFANGHSGSSSPQPFDKPAELPRFVPASPLRRSVVLMHNNYYHFNCLATGLLARGWDAVTVSLCAPDDPQQRFFHGEDINLFDPDPQRRDENVRRFFKTVPERFGAAHFYGMGTPGLFADNWENVEDPEKLPWDLIELRRHGLIIGYMPSGCLDGGLQSSIHKQTGGLCDRCVWQLQPDVCSDARSLAWNNKLARICDWVGLECDHATPERVGPKMVYGPVVTTLDTESWHPNLVPPDDMRIERQPGETLIYHAVGNYEQRRKLGRDIKGTGAVEAAIERLKAEGLAVRLIFAHDIPSTQVRFLQVQADIVVDQLNYGRYGANAREAMMLGKPTICRLEARQAAPLKHLRPILEAPLISATEQTVTDVLRALVTDAPRRADLSRRSRAFAAAWHGHHACAERYERVIDRIRRGLTPESEDLYPRDDSAYRPV